jgi:hypothetical protein
MPETLDFVWAHAVRPHKIAESRFFLIVVKYSIKLGILKTAMNQASARNQA